MPELRGPLPDDLVQFREFQTGHLCGPNSIYLFLRLLGKDVGYDTVRRDFDVRSQGVSVAELKAVAERYGVKTEVRKKVTARELPTAPMPLLVHVLPRAPDGVSPETGHFIVLTRIQSVGTDDAAFVASGIDTNNLRPTKFAFKGLEQRMTGYVLIPVAAAHSFHRVIDGAIWAVNVFLSAFAVAAGLRRRARGAAT